MFDISLVYILTSLLAVLINIVLVDAVALNSRTVDFIQTWASDTFLYAKVLYERVYFLSTHSVLQGFHRKCYKYKIVFPNLKCRLYIYRSVVVLYCRIYICSSVCLSFCIYMSTKIIFINFSRKNILPHYSFYCFTKLVCFFHFSIEAKIPLTEPC